jgi:hypothetical protein
MTQIFIPDKVPDRNNLRKEGFILLTERFYSTVVGRMW